MSHIDSYVAECCRMIDRARLVQRHYPDARLRDLFPDGDRVWCAAGAQQHATGVDVLIAKNTLGQPAAFFCAYHEIREREGEDGEVRARVYSDDWPAKVEDWDLAARMRSDPELLAATLRALRRER